LIRRQAVGICAGKGGHQGTRLKIPCKEEEEGKGGVAPVRGESKACFDIVHQSRKEEIILGLGEKRMRKRKERHTGAGWIVSGGKTM
jgi:hypothetical protein